MRELERAVDAVVVGERERLVPELRGTRRELLWLRRAVEERIRGVAMELDVSQGVLLGPGEGETITDRAERTIRLLCSHPLLDVTWSRYEDGEDGPEPHVHHEHVDSFYVLEGEVVFTLGGSQRVVAGPETWISVPQDVVHTFRNESGSTAAFLNYHAPSGGFAANLLGRRDGREVAWDSYDPPADGGRPANEAVVNARNEGELIDHGQSRLLVKAELPQLSVFESSFAFGWEGVDPHVHRDHLDSFFGLDGNGEYLHGETRTPGGVGTFAAIPPGITHGFGNLGPGTLRVLNVHAPDAGTAANFRQR
jgi:quercetin dioxygenase-like cupin family protein